MKKIKQRRNRIFFTNALKYGFTFRDLSKITGIEVKVIKEVVSGVRFWMYPYTKIEEMRRITRIKLEKESKDRKERRKIKQQNKIVKVQIYKKAQWRENGLDFIREKVRNRDNQTCIVCNKIWKEGLRKFDVHHKEIDEGRNARYSYDSQNMDKLITICHRCHCYLHAVIRRTKFDTDYVLNNKEKLFKYLTD